MIATQIALQKNLPFGECLWEAAQNIKEAVYWDLGIGDTGSAVVDDRMREILISRPKALTRGGKFFPPVGFDLRYICGYGVDEEIKEDNWHTAAEIGTTKGLRLFVSRCVRDGLIDDVAPLVPEVSAMRISRAGIREINELRVKAHAARRLLQLQSSAGWVDFKDPETKEPVTVPVAVPAVKMGTGEGKSGTGDMKNGTRRTGRKAGGA